jgi:glycosyltransferase involved in cell wall biosynthesis
VKTPAVSVIIPTFNRPAFLEEAVQSVLAQKFSDYEIIVIDDGSEGRFQERIQDLRRFYAQLSVYRLPSNKGASVARNFGLRKSKGDYILFLDDDDLLHPEMLEGNLLIFEKDPQVDVVTCLSNAFIDHRSPEAPLQLDSGEAGMDLLNITYPLNDPNYLSMEHISFSALLHFTLIISSCLVKKDCIKDTRFPENLTAGEDTYFWMELASRGCDIVSRKRVGAYVRFHPWSGRLNLNYADASIEFFNEVLSSGMLRNRDDLFIVHAQLALKFLRMRRPEMVKHLLFTLRSPDLVHKYLRSYLSREARRMRSIYRLLEKSRKYPQGPVRKNG